MSRDTDYLYMFFLFPSFFKMSRENFCGLLPYYKQLFYLFFHLLRFQSFYLVNLHHRELVLFIPYTLNTTFYILSVIREFSMTWGGIWIGARVGTSECKSMQRELYSSVNPWCQ